MASPGKRKRRVRADESLITDFLELRDSSIVQTGPKRPRRGGMIPLTPLPRRRPKGIPSSSSKDATKNTPLTTTVRDLIESAAEVSALTPGPSARTTLTPTPARTPRRSPRLSVLETSPTERRVLRSALKRTSTLRKPGREGDSQVSFGKYVTVNEYSPEYGHGDSLTSVERDESGARGRVLEPLEEEGSEEEEEAGESEGSEIGGEKEEGSSKDEEEAGESGGGVVGGEYGGSEEEEGEGEESEDGEVGGGSEEEERSEEEESEERLKTPYTSSQKARRLPQLTTPAYSDFRPVRKSRPSPVRRRAPTRQRKQRKPVKTLPRSMIKNLFTLFCKKRVTKDAMDLIVKFTEVYLNHASEDLVVFARHAGRKTIEVEDIILLLGRQRHISESQEFEYLVNTYLPLEYVEELLPCAVAGKQIVPRMKS